MANQPFTTKRPVLEQKSPLAKTAKQMEADKQNEKSKGLHASSGKAPRMQSKD